MGGEDPPQTPPHDAGGPICHPHQPFTLYSTIFEFPALFAYSAWGISTHPRHTKILFSPFPPRQNPCHAIPATPKSFSCRPHYTITLYSIKFEFPALFAYIAWGVSTLPRHAKIRFCPSRHAKTLVTPSPPCQNPVLAIPTILVHCTVLSLNFPPFFRQTLADRADSGDKRQDIWSDHTLKVSARSGQGARTSSISNRRTDRRTDGRTDRRTACETPLCGCLNDDHVNSIPPPPSLRSGGG